MGVSYLSGGKWCVAAVGDLIEIDEAQVQGALERGLIKPPKAVTPARKVKEADDGA
jgi:hypothetical protein